MPNVRPSTSRMMDFIDNESSVVDEMSIDVDDEVPATQTQTQRSRRQTQDEPEYYWTTYAWFLGEGPAEPHGGKLTKDLSDHKVWLSQCCQKTSLVSP